MQTQADMGIGPVSCENCSVFKKGEGGPEAPGALRLRNKMATASVASSYSQNPPVQGEPPVKKLAPRNEPPFVLKVDSWVIRPYRHPSTKTGRSRRYPNRFSSGLEGGQFMKLFVGWYPFKLWNKY